MLTSQLHARTRSSAGASGFLDARESASPMAVATKYLSYCSTTPLPRLASPLLPFAMRERAAVSRSAHRSFPEARSVGGRARDFRKRREARVHRASLTRWQWTSHLGSAALTVAAQGGQPQHAPPQRWPAPERPSTLGNSDVQGSTPRGPHQANAGDPPRHTAAGRPSRRCGLKGYDQTWRRHTTRFGTRRAWRRPRKA